MFSDHAWEQIALSFKITTRELQIIRATFDDQKESFIAASLGISANTVHTHIARLHHKLAVADRAQLVLLVMARFLALTVAPASVLPSLCSNRAAGRCPLQG